MTIERMNLLDKVIYDLKGTTQDAEEVAAYYGLGELSIKDFQYIESEIFLCEGCGWWCEICEDHYLDDGHYCQQCFEEMGEEDE